MKSPADRYDGICLFVNEVGQGGLTLRQIAQHEGLKVTPYLRWIVNDLVHDGQIDRLRVPVNATMVRDVYYPANTLRRCWEGGDQVPEVPQVIDSDPVDPGDTGLEYSEALNSDLPY